LARRRGRAQEERAACAQHDRTPVPTRFGEPDELDDSHDLDVSHVLDGATRPDDSQRWDVIGSPQPIDSACCDGPAGSVGSTRGARCAHIADIGNERRTASGSTGVSG
jgi:hypothetical protein